jgi:O-antigen/teichoic acid export membrane protein
MRSGPLLLGYLRGEAEVGWFGAASRLSEAAKLIPNGLFAAAFPAFAATASAGRTDLLWKSLGRVLVPLTLALALGLSLGARPALRLAYGPPFLPAETALIWLSLCLVPNLLNGGMEVYLYAAGDEVYALELGTLAVGIQILTSLPLITWFGASGAAVAMLLGEVAIWWPLRCRVRRRIETPAEARATPRERSPA